LVVLAEPIVETEMQSDRVMKTMKNARRGLDFGNFPSIVDEWSD
jgi:hypothetical protein